MIKDFLKFLSEDIWIKREHEYKSQKVRWAVKQAKVFIFTARGFGEHSIMVRSAALTFYTIMSLVPIAALVFGISKGFGLEGKLSDYLYDQFPQYQLLIEQIIDFANAMLQRTKGGLIASVGLVVLFWAVMKVFGNIENAFNSIWEVRKSRSLARKFSDYIAVIFVTPILWTISNTIRLNIQDKLLYISSSTTLNVVYAITSLVSIWVMFAFIYRVMPNTKVKMFSAITAGIVAGTVFQLFQIAYIYVQSQVSSYNAIYGSFAAVPLFLIWLQTSWQILLSGAELSFSYQNIKKYEYEKIASQMSYEYRKKVTVAVMQAIVSHFVKGGGAVSSEIISSELNLPVRIVRDAVFDLEKAELIAPIVGQDDKVNLYIPARDIHSLTVFDVIRGVESSGKDNLDMEQSEEYQKVSEIVDDFNDELSKSQKNIKLVDIKP